MIAAIDGSQTGDIKTTKWAVKGDQFGFSSPVIDGTRVYQIENGSRLKAFDLETGRELWRQPLGTVQKAPLVMADGKLYVGTESGKFFIVRPLADQRGGAERGRAAEEPRRQRRAVGRACPSRCSAARRSRAAASSSSRRGGVYAIGPKTRQSDDRHRGRPAASRRATARRRSCRSARPSWC